MARCCSSSHTRKTPQEFLLFRGYINCNICLLEVVRCLICRTTNTARPYPRYRSGQTLSCDPTRDWPGKPLQSISIFHNNKATKAEPRGTFAVALSQAANFYLKTNHKKNNNTIDNYKYDDDPKYMGLGTPYQCRLIVCWASGEQQRSRWCRG